MSAELFADDLWQLKLPNKWQGEPGEGCATFFHSDGVGALQIETFCKQGDVDDNDLRQLAGDLVQSRQTQPLRVGDFNGFSLELTEQNDYWRYWFVAAGDCALAITYNCDVQDCEKESGVVLEILRSLRVRL